MKKYFILYKILFLSLPGFAQLKISTGARVVNSGNVVINIQNLDMNNDGTFTPGSGKVKFTGDDGNYIGGSATTSFNELEIAKTNNTLVLFSNVNVNSRVNFVSGMIDLNQKTMTLGNNAVLNNENENSRITGLKGGEVVISTNLNKPNNVNPGNLGAVISAGTNLGNVVVKRGHKEQAGSGLTGSVNRYYSITVNGKKAANATIRLKYFDAELNGQDENTMTFYQSLNNGGSWTNQSFSSRDAAANWVEKTAMSSLGTLTLSNNINAPIIVQSPTFAPEKNTDLAKKITVGPNPNNGNFWFKISGIEKESIATIYTIDGKVIKQFKVANLQQQQVNGLRNGMYILRVEGLQPFRIVVQGDGNPTNNNPVINNNATKF
jgi:hypothetical protein